MSEIFRNFVYWKSDNDRIIFIIITNISQNSPCSRKRSGHLSELPGEFCFLGCHDHGADKDSNRPDMGYLLDRRYHKLHNHT